MQHFYVDKLIFIRYFINCAYKYCYRGFVICIKEMYLIKRTYNQNILEKNTKKTTEIAPQQSKE